MAFRFWCYRTFIFPDAEPALASDEFQYSEPLPTSQLESEAPRSGSGALLSRAAAPLGARTAADIPGSSEASAPDSPSRWELERFVVRCRHSCREAFVAAVVRTFASSRARVSRSGDPPRRRRGGGRPQPKRGRNSAKTGGRCWSSSSRRRPPRPVPGPRTARGRSRPGRDTARSKTRAPELGGHPGALVRDLHHHRAAGACGCGSSPAPRRASASSPSASPAPGRTRPACAAASSRGRRPRGSAAVALRKAGRHSKICCRDQVHVRSGRTAEAAARVAGVGQQPLHHVGQPLDLGERDRRLLLDRLHVARPR